tara:strand:+ start:360 stop:1472 length:1113 start_codon:yes stop_codon:yes gene_type:complete
VKNISVYKNGLLILLLTIFIGSKMFASESGLQETLKDRAIAWIADKNDVETENVSIGWSDQRLRFPRCSDAWQFRLKENIPNIFEINCENEEWSISLRYTIETTLPIISHEYSTPPRQILAQQYITVKREMDRGEMVTANDINWSSDPTTEQNLEASPFVGQFLNVSVSADARLFSSMLSEGEEALIAVNDINQGQNVTPLDFEKKLMLPRRGDDLLPVNFEFARDSKALAFISQGEVVKSSMVGSPVEALTANRLIMPGELISEMNSEIKIIYGDTPSGAITDLDQLRRSVATTQIQPGKVIRFIDARRQHDIMEGDEVKLTVVRQAFSLELSMIAAESGFLGDTVELMNPESGRTVKGTVTGNKSAIK